MQKPWWIAALVVAPVALVITTTVARAQENWLDNSCAVTGESSAGASKGGRFGSLVKKVKQGADLVSKGLLDDGPICGARTHEEVLLLTGIMMDRAALAAAKGVDAAQEALGRKRTLEAKIAELDRALNGIGSSPTAFGSGDSPASEGLVEEVSQESQALVIALQALKDSNALDPQAREKLAEARRNLHEVTYYGVSAVAGGTVFARFWNSNQSKANITTMLQRVGFRSDFAERLPGRAKNLPNTFKNTVALKTTISAVVADTDKEADEGEKRAKKRAQEDSDAVRAGLRSLGVTTTPR